MPWLPDKREGDQSIKHFANIEHKCKRIHQNMKTVSILEYDYEDHQFYPSFVIQNDLEEDDNIGQEYVKVDRDDEVKVWAVVVGIGRYTTMPVLKYTDDDAYHIYAFLKSPEGGALPDSQIRLLIDEDAFRGRKHQSSV